MKLSVCASTCALLCLGCWNSLGLVRDDSEDEDVSAVTSLDEVDAQAELTKLGNMLKACYH